MHSGFYKAPTRNPESKALPIHLRKSKQIIAKLFAQPSTFKSSLALVWVRCSQYSNIFFLTFSQYTVSWASVAPWFSKHKAWESKKLKEELKEKKNSIGDIPLLGLCRMERLVI